MRELVAVDGVDSSEILLIDSQGCPTDASIMGIVTRVSGNAQQLEAPFDAFKFPSSDVVQFRALVTPCVPACEPVTCNLVNPETGLNKEALSYGRRRRRSTRNLPPGGNDDVVVVGAIKITDTFDYKTKNRDDQHQHQSRRGHHPDGTSVDIFEETIRNEVLSPEGVGSTCTNFTGLIITLTVLLISQLTLVIAWYYIYRMKMQHKVMTNVRCLYCAAAAASQSTKKNFGISVM